MSQGTVADAKRKADQATDEAKPWAKILARVGYAAKGIVYAVIGVLAVQVAVGAGGQTTGSSGALQSIAGSPFGTVLLIIIGVGLIGYSLWQFARAFLDPEHNGSDGKAIVKRLGYAGSGVIHIVLSFTAFGIVFGSGGGDNSEGSTDSMTARLMEQPFGRWLVGIVALVVIGIGVYQMYKGYKAKFREDLNIGEMSKIEETWATRVGRFGLIARGVVFSIAGVFLVIAAVQANPEQAKGLGGSLDTLAQQPFGPFLLGIVALGLIAYGIFMGVQARYRHIPG